ncbi:MAG TPA: short-chain dehydrogenase, partial [Dehalococcoidia bacterium]|nr:short-chain dehydrogenase [Dehalococcoidia bacterium]
MPGHIGTEISANTGKVLGHPDPLDMPAEDVAIARRQMSQRGLPIDSLSDDEIRAAIKQRATDFRENAPTTASQAATIIINGVREDRWRVLIGEDARALDDAVRSHPEDAYEGLFMERIQSQGHMTGIVPIAEKAD